MKQFILFVAVLAFTLTAYAQLKITDNDTTSQLVKGTYLKEGKIHIMKGYKVQYSIDKKIAAIMNAQTHGSSGGYICKCTGTTGNDDCAPATVGALLVCLSREGWCPDGCTIFISSDKKTAAIKHIDSISVSKVKWKRLLL